MKKFTLEVFCTLIGIGPASGIHWDGHSVYLVSDNAAEIYRYEQRADVLEKLPLYPADPSVNIPKKQKADLESLVFSDGAFYAFGSGSRPNRERAFRCVFEPPSVKAIDLSVLYRAMRDLGNIDPENFNLEGALHLENRWHFFQRGNGALGQNGMFTVEGRPDNPGKISYHKIELPKINGFASGITDATVVGKDCYFLASAEDSASTFEDGDVAGSAIGMLDLKSGKVLWFEIVSDQHKFEGLTLYREDATVLEFLVCEDNDSEVLRSVVYRLTVWK